MEIKSITVKAETASLDEVLDFIAQVSEEMPMKMQTQLAIAVEEIFVNIASYAYGSEGDGGNTTISVADDAEKVFVTFEDCGVPYNPLLKEDPDITKSADEREIGGLGIFMVKKMMDGMDYRFEDGKNIFTIYKTLK
jgi:anti-sigma regulatory factor (Ser/Thr protein kinase)